MVDEDIETVNEIMTIDFGSTEPASDEEIDEIAKTSADDRDWFAAHPGRKNRFRLMSTAEYKRRPLPMCSTETPVTLVHQMVPGVRERFFMVIPFSALDARWARYFNGDDAVLEPIYQQMSNSSPQEIRDVCDGIRDDYAKDRGT